MVVLPFLHGRGDDSIWENPIEGLSSHSSFQKWKLKGDSLTSGRQTKMSCTFCRGKRQPPVVLLSRKTDNLDPEGCCSLRPGVQCNGGLLDPLIHLARQGGRVPSLDRQFGDRTSVLPHFILRSSSPELCIPGCGERDC